MWPKRKKVNILDSTYARRGSNVARQSGVGQRHADSSAELTVEPRIAVQIRWKFGGYYWDPVLVVALSSAPISARVSAIR